MLLIRKRLGTEEEEEEEEEGEKKGRKKNILSRDLYFCSLS
jgi:hypothetical protein